MFEYLGKFFTLVVTYIVLGRKGTIPMGFVLFNSWVFIFLSILLIEIIQIPMFYILLGPIASNFEWVVKLKRRFTNKIHKITASKVFRYAQKVGVWGIFLVVVMPSGTGGVLGGIILSKLLNINYKKSVIAIISGILVCNLILVIGLEGAKRLLCIFYPAFNLR